MQKFAKIHYKEEKENKQSDYKTSFVLEPLERGFARTLGNALRRTILSSVSSVAPFAVKIEGVEHEFGAIENVTEDVVTILNNLKKIKFVYNKDVFKDNVPVKVSFNSENFEGDQVCAKDILVSPEIKIVNLDQPITKISKKGAFNFEMYLLSGRGFVSFEDNKKIVSEFGSSLESKLKSGKFLAVDSDFSPVLNVNYTVDELNSASTIVEEKLELTVETDGTIEAKEAISEAAKILMIHLGIVSNVDNLDLNEKDFFEEEKVKEEVPKDKSIDINELSLTVRSLNALRRAGFKTVSDLEKIDEEELQNVKNLGKKSVQEIIEKLKERGIVLKKEGE
ncbi:DNA-directed RNA polymerase subunit alpha [Mesomycoplasma lagogenitalium]|uniref:DNA-directed RNA polymerase subunit alpha n=1 Tax=Mesomycoplasma lagogenitalium TaxID=171286 RepID=A0ABY8LTJ0_9BACT|nr:DNA-directed RNA polymerase subunit alpha [Mesomycoplasma lagogenitalium]WGI36562.1 DNA-directed RNA polymerase subunit alpha [Mesomycoplasma lagogenitalium]